MSNSYRIEHKCPKCKTTRELKVYIGNLFKYTDRECKLCGVSMGVTKKGRKQLKEAKNGKD